MADTTLAIPQELTDLPDAGAEQRTFSINPPNPPNVINGSEGNDIIATTAQDDAVKALGGNDIINGSKGNDLLIGGKGKDTVNYSRLGGPVTLGVAGKVFKGSGGSFGTDQLIGIETLIGSSGAGDLIDASAASSGTVPINVNLSTQTLSVIGIPGLGTQNFTVRNFENVNGTPINDIITGDFKNNVLNGGDGDDILSGTVGTNLRSTEVDTLIGGAGDDTFVLGQGDTLYYSSNKNADFAKITDFGNGADQIFLADGNYATNDDVTRLFAIKPDGTRDLIANITYSSGISDSSSQRQTASAFASSGDALVDPLVASNTFSLSQGQSFGIFSASII
jgi:serralysin